MEDANRNLEEQIKHLCDRTSDALDRRILNDLAGKLQKQEPCKPTPKSAGIWRMPMISKRLKIAAAAVVALAILLPVSYAAVEAVVKYFTVEDIDVVSFQYNEPNNTMSYAVKRVTVVTTDTACNEAEARAQLAEFAQLYRDGKAREIKPGVWQARLSNGELFNYGGDPEHVTAQFTPEEKERLKKEFDEINALRKAGTCERTFLKEVEQDGVKIRLYQVRYTLADGKVVTLTEGANADGNGGGSSAGSIP
jgi:hypothetical protein